MSLQPNSKGRRGDGPELLRGTAISLFFQGATMRRKLGYAMVALFVVGISIALHGQHDFRELSYSEANAVKGTIPYKFLYAVGLIQSCEDAQDVEGSVPGLDCWFSEVGSDCYTCQQLHDAIVASYDSVTYTGESQEPIGCGKLIRGTCEVDLDTGATVCVGAPADRDCNDFIANLSQGPP
jgi:hypothetical protein